MPLPEHAAPAAVSHVVPAPVPPGFPPGLPLQPRRSGRAEACAGTVRLPVRAPGVDPTPACVPALAADGPRATPPATPTVFGTREAGPASIADAAGRFPALDPVREADPLPPFERRLDGPESRRARLMREQGGELWTV
ncbi:hypothetical protein B5V46_18320 (plasmid) [Rhodovulum sp. MB263]|nr:hypothetical protein B5V46_18320 [Rhodovulum sp. MB263]